MANPWYRTGTVSVTNNSLTVTGAGTLFVINSVANGDIFFGPDNKAYEVDTVQNDTTFTLKSVYVGSTLTAQPYGLVRFMAQAPISLANIIVDKTVKWEALIDQHALYLSGDATTTVTAPEDLCVNYSLGEVKTGVAQADAPVGFTFVASAATLTAGWFLFSDTVGNYRVSQHPETFKAEITAMKDLAATSATSVAPANFTELLKKTNTSLASFEVSGATLITSQSITVNNAGAIVVYAQGAVVTLPTLASATDYKIYATATGLVARAWGVAAPASSVELGGFHAYHTGATINPNSIWDLRWRPVCSPRGMTLSTDKKVWVDIYLMDIDYGIDGYSKGNSTIADGSSLAKIPLIYGGDGTAAYASHSWFNAIDLAVSAGKRLPFYAEFTGFAYGVVEAQSVGADPVTTKYNAGYRSACGVEQATGTLWQWGADINGTSAVGTAGWQAITEGRGSVYVGDIKAVLLGANWSNGANAGSRASYWSNSPSASSFYFGSRALCDHLAL
ncbi:MAG: hypothetical protein PF440_10460 [Thiomicrorhabdus sp.]|jgi:hypothetical protein|nr:hypothetical protein [Thiomicrorhabdus sp.]